MQRFLFTATVCACLGVLPLRAQRVATDSILACVPAALLPSLDLNARLNLCDLYNYHMRAEAENRYGGRTLMTAKTPDYVCLETSDAGRWELKRLSSLTPQAEGNGWETVPFYSVVRTLTAAGAASSHIYFYDTQWQQLRPPFPLVSLNDFWAAPDTLDAWQAAELRRLLQEPRVELRWEPDATVLTYSVSTAHLADRAELAQRCLRPLRYEWTGQSFVRLP